MAIVWKYVLPLPLLYSARDFRDIRDVTG